MKKFEYYIVPVDLNSCLSNVINLDALGSDGWKLVSVDKGIAYFIREQKNLLNKLQDGTNNG